MPGSTEETTSPWKIAGALAWGAAHYGINAAGSCLDFAIGAHNAVRGIPGPQFADPDHAQDLKEAGVVTGLVLLSEIPWNPASEEAKEAYALAYPGLASKESLEEAIQRLDSQPQALEGLLAGIKGKMMEVRSADLLAETLPAGVEVQLASSPTQAGYDLEFQSSSGELFGVAQVKATETPQAILDHYQQYPHIPVITTQENVEALGDHPILATQQPGISNAELGEELAALENVTGAIEAVPLGASAVLLWHLGTGEGSFGDRLQTGATVLGRNTPAVLMGGLAGMITGGTLWIVLPVVFGSRWLTGEGQKYRLSVWKSMKQRWTQRSQELRIYPQK